MGRLSILIGAVLLAAMIAPPAQGASAIAYSNVDEYYGWCAGFAEPASCAQQECRAAGGSECVVVLICGSGWGAIAFARDGVRGFGAVCGTSNAWSARSAALGRCMEVANALCETYATFDRNGNQRSRAANEEFDRTWFAQLMLQLRNFELGNADGEMGPRTRAAGGLPGEDRASTERGSSTIR